MTGDSDPQAREGGWQLPVVALVGSAGGLTAVRHVIGALPRDFPAAVLVLIHQSPDRPTGLLAQLIANKVALPTVEIEDGVQLDASRVFVAPPGRHVLVRGGGSLQIIEVGSFPPPRPSADLLLTTLALAAGPRATAVILSGGGSDGATGATAIRHNGGRVIVTDSGSSENFSMPKATIDRDDIKPEVVDLEALPGLLTGTAAPAEHSA